MWFRDPFTHFYRDADFQIACDYYNGNSWDRNNSPNGGFSYVKSNDRAIKFYKYWYSSRQKFPKENDQDVLNRLKHDPIITEIGLKMRFLDTAFYGGFCQPSRNLNLVCTMHANCCVGLGNKIHDLRIMLDDWRKFKSPANNTQSPSLSSWSVPQNCRYVYVCIQFFDCYSPSLLSHIYNTHAYAYITFIDFASALNPSSRSMDHRRRPMLIYINGSMQLSFL